MYFVLKVYNIKDNIYIIKKFIFRGLYSVTVIDITVSSVIAAHVLNIIFKKIYATITYRAYSYIDNCYRIDLSVRQIYKWL